MEAEVTNISPHGFWLLIGGTDEVFVSFDAFPWFRHATIAQLTNVRLPSRHHLRWPDLDVDVAVESLTHPERYPLISRVRSAGRSTPAPAALKESSARYKSGRRRSASSR